MKTSKRALLIYPLTVISVLVLAISCKAAKFDSVWKDRDIIIDGMQFDWENALSNLQDDKVNIGIMNDDKYLYVCLVPLDETIIRQAMGLGFTVWIESPGNKKGKFGIHYPIGFRGEGPDDFRDMNQRPNPEEFRKMAENSLNEFQIIKADKKDTVTQSVDNVSGLEVRIGARNERMVYEMRIPLHRTDEDPYAANTEAGGKVKLHFETGEFKRPAGQRPGGFGGPPEGGIGDGGGGMPPGGGGGGMGGSRPGAMRGGFERPQPLNLKLDIKLAKAESTKN